MNAKCITELIGGTPILELCRTKKRYNLSAEIHAKLESFNPGGSVKDRVGQAMIEAAEEKGLLKKGGTIIEPTSGNTGIGLALTAAVKGYRLILTMPDTMSIERRRILQAYGAELVLTPGQEGMSGAIAKAAQLYEQYPGAYIPQQFTNPANPAVHKRFTGPEIWKDMAGKINYFIAGVGTGGTITGVGEYLKEKDPRIRIVAVEPASSAVLSGKAPGSHQLQGIGAGFVPGVLNRAIIDEIIMVEDQQAFTVCRELGKNEGLAVGISSGAAAWAAIQIATREENEGKRLVVLLPDGGDRYLSVKGLYDVKETDAKETGNG